MKYYLSESELMLFMVKRISDLSKVKLSKDQLVKINWCKLADTLYRHKIFALLYEFIISYVPKKYQSKYDGMYYDIISKNKIMFNELKRLDTEFKCIGINYVLLKGFGLSSLLYDNIYSRQQGDIDILFKRKDISVVQKLVEEYDYKCVYKRIDFEKRFLPFGYRVMHFGFHECEYRKQISDQITLKVELHVNCGSIDEEFIEEFSSLPLQVRIKECNFSIMNINHLFIYLCVNAYENLESWNGAHNNTYFRDIIEVYLFISKYKKQLDFKILSILTKKYKMEYKLYFIFKIVNAIYVNIIPNEEVSMFDFDISNYANRCYASGSFVDWKSSIIQRMINDEERIREYNRLYFLRCHSVMNPNYCEKWVIRRANQVDKNNLSEYKIFIDNEYKYEIKYLISFDDDRLHLDFCVDDNVFDIMYRLQILFAWLKNFKTYDYNIDNPMEYITILRNGTECFAIIPDKIEIKASVSNAVNSNKKIISFKAPLSNFKVSDSGELCYNILIREFVYNDCFRWCGGQYENYNPEGKLGVISFEEYKN